MADEIKDNAVDDATAPEPEAKAAPAPKAEPPKADKPKKAKKEQKKEPGKVRRWFKDFFSELKKVTWPTFPKVLKQTGIVLLVTVCFLVVMLAFDALFGYLNHLLIGGLSEDSVALALNAVSNMLRGGGGLL